MYPRLILARELLSDDGVIFISIDDNEQVNLRLVCDEIFGEENKVGNLPTIMNLKGNQDEFAFAGTHEYTVVYSKNKINLNISGLEIDEEYILSDWSRDDMGFFKKGASLISTGQNAPREHRPNLWFPIFYKDNSLMLPPEEFIQSIYDEITGKFNDDILEDYAKQKELEGYTTILPFVNEQKARWRWSYKKLQRQLEEIIITKTRNGISLYKKQRPELTDLPSKKMKTLLYKPEYSSGNGTSEVKELFNIARLFSNPKPISLILDLISISTNSIGEDIILDFFSGSATTAHAVMQLNAEDSGNRKYIMVQLPEVIKEGTAAYQEGYRTIDEIGRERIRRAANKIREETGANIDYGFKSFKLESINQNTLNKMIDFTPGELLVHEDMVSVFDSDKSSGKNSILATWLNDDGYGLTAEATIYTLKNYEADLYQDSLYIIKEGFYSDDVMELIKRLETMELDINRVVVYPYSIDFSVMQELKKNIKNLRNNKSVEVIERY